MLERIAAHMDVSIDELEKAVDADVDLDASKCAARVSKDGCMSQCVRPRRKGHELCEVHFKQAASNGGLKHGQYESSKRATAAPPHMPSASATKGAITVRLTTYMGLPYFYDHVSSRVYDVDTRALIGILTDNGLIEVNKDYLI